MSQIFTTTDDVSGLLPVDYGQLVVQPVQDESVAIQVSSTVVTDSHDFHVPILTEDASASWTEEGGDLYGGDDPVFAELKVTPQKVGRAIDISNELADDSSPEATETVGRSLARAIATQIDQAYFGAFTYPTPDPENPNAVHPRPKGLEHLALTGDSAVQEVGAGAAFANLDPFAAAIALSQAEGGNITSFVANPADYLTLMTLKRETGSNESLLGMHATEATKRVLLGVPLLASRHVTAGTIWGIDKSFATVVLRSDVAVESSRHAKFGTDMTAIKATMRVGFAFTNPKALVKITLGA